MEHYLAETKIRKGGDVPTVVGGGPNYNIGKEGGGGATRKKGMKEQKKQNAYKGGDPLLNGIIGKINNALQINAL